MTFQSPSEFPSFECHAQIFSAISGRKMQNFRKKLGLCKFARVCVEHFGNSPKEVQALPCHMCMEHLEWVQLGWRPVKS